ncbi:hypothetical protein [Ruminobacter sp. RM87]|uniref:hypothetical protein n=1 Tax=Ruminobacter sp. RM87 TaxID=1200567 RepID=UPI0004E22DF3|nr:hypothetical protein [Ruminobacter sp. RM87]
MGLYIKDTDIELSNLFELNQPLSPEIKNNIDNIDFIAIPSKYTDGSCYYAKESVNFIKYCRQKDFNHSYKLLDSGDVSELSLHSFDIWMPIIWVSSNVLLPLAVSMAANYIHDRMKGRENEDAKVDMTFIIKSKGKNKSLHYNGDAKAFKKSFDKIDLNKM